MPRHEKPVGWAQVVDEAKGDKTKLYAHEGALQQGDDPPPGSPERLELVRTMAAKSMAERKRQEALEAAKTDEQRRQEEADRREAARGEDLRLEEEARAVERAARHAAELTANSTIAPIDPARAPAFVGEAGLTVFRGVNAGKNPDPPKMVPPARSAQRWNTPLTVTLHGRVTQGSAKWRGFC